MPVNLNKTKTYEVKVLHKELVVREAFLKINASSIEEAKSLAKFEHENGNVPLTPYNDSQVSVLWEECKYTVKHTRPFDLEAALRGEPVVLRNGKKAFVKVQQQLAAYDHERIFGVVYDSDFDEETSSSLSMSPLKLSDWCLAGYVYNDDQEDLYDIVAMWEN